MKMTSADLIRMNRMLRHRLRNTASGIKSSVALMAEELKDVAPPDILEYFPLMIQECESLTVLTDRINAFFEGTVPDRMWASGSMGEQVKTETLAMNVADTLRGRFPGIAMAMRVDAAAAAYSVPEAKRMAFAFFELAVNAAEAAGRTYAVDGYVLVDDTMLRMGITNGGPVMDPNVREQMFDPFFTTKSRHIGIGLNLAQTFTEACGGDVHALANPDGGMTVELRLPVNKLLMPENRP